jgi:hypothetical protein
VVVGPSARLDQRVRQPDGRAVYDLLGGHPDRTARDLVFVADLAVELRAWQGTDFAHQASTSMAWPRRWCGSPAAARSARAGTTG